MDGSGASLDNERSGYAQTLSPVDNWADQARCEVVDSALDKHRGGSAIVKPR